MGGGSARLLQGPLPNAMREGQEWVGGSVCRAAPMDEGPPGPQRAGVST